MEWLFLPIILGLIVGAIVKMLADAKEEEERDRQAENKKEAKIIEILGFRKGTPGYNVSYDINRAVEWYQRSERLSSCQYINQNITGNDKQIKSCKIIEFFSGYKQNVNIEKFKEMVADLMKITGSSLRRNDPAEILEKNGGFPNLFIFAHKTSFYDKYGNDESGYDAVVAIPTDELRKIQQGFSSQFLSEVAKVEYTASVDAIDIYKFIGEFVKNGSLQTGITVYGKQKRNVIPDEVRNELLSLANFACQECGAKQSDGATLEVDHIIPVSKGGDDSLSNLQILCATCNRKKSNKL
jgi:5-methylcytosine-specific restriction enzyme A